MENPKVEGLAKTLEAPEGSIRLVYSKDKSELDKSKEYQKLQRRMGAYRLFFKKFYLENISCLPLLQDLLGCRDADEVQGLKADLEAWFAKAANGAFPSSGWVSSVCPGCLRFSLTRYSHDGEKVPKVCQVCGEEVDDAYVDIDDFNQDLDRDLTFAPTSFQSWTKGLGSTFNSRKNLHKLLSDNKVYFDEFKADHPEIAEELLLNLIVTTEDFAYHLDIERNVVRKVNISVFYKTIFGLFHQFDVPLRKTKALLAESTPNNLKSALGYSEQLCKNYGITVDSARDQAFRNTLGHDIRIMKVALKLQGYNMTTKRLVDTLFYLNLLLFQKPELARRAKEQLEVDPGIVNYFSAFSEFLKAHNKIDNSSTLLNALEHT
jgi:hypothetical protein